MSIGDARLQEKMEREEQVREYGEGYVLLGEALNDLAAAREKASKALGLLYAGPAADDIRHLVRSIHSLAVDVSLAQRKTQE